MPDLAPGDIVWVFLDPVVGREQSGRRPAVVVSSRGHLAIADTLVIVVPVTSVDRGWSNHILLQGDVPARESWAMTEQVRTISRQRVAGRAGRVDSATLAEIREWIRDFIDE
ncbi:MAG: type II toxin-antitoxin system PemK/MazF family toxin [Micropruina sp.]|uniref:type II toxin-antitoxin system PemK/MazF family toxin n=1 Tax=Micropruina sp. TaxID=2737536 RepID=UPI0039E50A62